MDKITDRTIYRLDFVLTASVTPDSYGKRVTAKNIVADLEKLRDSKFEPLDCPYANLASISVKKSKQEGKWDIEMQIDCEHTSMEGAESMLQAYYMVFSTGIGMLNDTGFFQYIYTFNRDDFEKIIIEVGYLQSDSKTIFFPKSKS